MRKLRIKLALDFWEFLCFLLLLLFFIEITGLNDALCTLLPNRNRQQLREKG